MDNTGLMRYHKEKYFFQAQEKAVNTQQILEEIRANIKTVVSKDSAFGQSLGRVFKGSPADMAYFFLTLMLKILVTFY